MAFHKGKAMLQNYLWFGQDHTTQTKVNWIDCYTRCKIRGLNSINQEEALNALLTKWVLLALELGTTNTIKK
jgi:hypothetical protein